jgi:hypothetical protein
MRAAIVGTVLGREWAEMIRNRLLLLTILVPPVVLTVAPLALAGLVDPGPAARVGGVHRR